MIRADIAKAAGDHDRLVVATHLFASCTHNLLLEGTEVTGQIGSPELVIERSATDWAFNHDVERRGDAIRLTVMLLPGLLISRDIQVRDCKPGETRLGLGASTGRPLITNFTTGTGCSTRVGRNSRRMIVRLHLHKDMDIFRVVTVAPRFGIRIKTASVAASNNRGIVFIG